MATANVNKLAEDVSYLRKDMAVVGALVDVWTRPLIN